MGVFWVLKHTENNHFCVFFSTQYCRLSRKRYEIGQGVLSLLISFGLIFSV